MSNIVLIDDFHFTEFFAQKELISQEIKGKGVNYPIQIESVNGPTSLQIKILIASPPDKEHKEQLIPIKQLILKDEGSADAEEEIILDGDDLVLIFTAPDGVFYIPVNIKSISLVEKTEQQTIVAGQAVVIGEVLNVKRHKFERINLNQEVNYFLSSLKYHGTIKDITPVGSRLIANQKIKANKVVIDFSFAEVPFKKLPGEITWRKEIDDRKFLYGINFKFTEPTHQAELEKWLIKL